MKQLVELCYVGGAHHCNWEINEICCYAQVVIQHLKEQLAQNAADSKQMSMLESVKSSLGSQVKQLENDLLEARSAHTPVSWFSFLRFIIVTNRVFLAARSQGFEISLCLATVGQESTTYGQEQMNWWKMQWGMIGTNKEGVPKCILKLQQEH